MSSASIVLIGPMGAGKTSVGRRVAKALGCRFVDTDAVVIRANGPIEEIFAQHGEAHFRALERRAVADALDGGGVVALGGGAVLDPDTRRDLAAHRIVLLTVDPERIASRIRGTKRPLLQAEDPIARWREVMAERRPVYDALADVVFDTSSGPLQHVVEHIVDWARDGESMPAATPPAPASNEETT